MEQNGRKTPLRSLCEANRPSVAFLPPTKKVDWPVKMWIYGLERVSGVSHTFPPDWTVCSSTAVSLCPTGCAILIAARKVQSSVKTFTLTPRRISGSYAGATHDGTCFIFNLCIFIEVFVLFFPMRRLEASGIRSLSYGKTFSTLNLLIT